MYALYAYRRLTSKDRWIAQRVTAQAQNNPIDPDKVDSENGQAWCGHSDSSLSSAPLYEGQ